MLLKCLAIIFLPFILLALAFLVICVTPLLIFILILKKNEQKKVKQNFKVVDRRLRL